MKKIYLFTLILFSIFCSACRSYYLDHPEAGTPSKHIPSIPNIKLKR